MVLKFAYLEDLDDVDPLNISGVERVKEIEQGKGGVDVTTVITLKTHVVVNGKPVTVSVTLVGGLACNTIFSWTFLQIIKASIITKNNYLVIGLLGEKLRREIMVP